MRKPSLKKALGVTKAKRDFVRMTGIPTSSSGRKRKMKKTLTGGCCSIYAFGLLAFSVLIIILIIIVNF